MNTLLAVVALAREHPGQEEIVLFLLGLALISAGSHAYFSVSVRQLTSHAYPGSPLPDLSFAAVVLGFAVWELAGPPLIRGRLRRSAGGEERATVPAQEDVAGARPR